MSLTKLTLAAGNNLIIPDHVDFGYGHPSWGLANRLHFFTVKERRVAPADC
jgi:hypothetical protein